MAQQPDKKRIKKIAGHYNSIKGNTKQERDNKLTINILKMNNFIKTMLIKEVSNDTILDLGCGKGGDLFKYEKNGYKEYMGLDIAENSILEAKRRSANITRELITDFMVQDCFTEEFDLKKKFEVVSCQFSLHYAFIDAKTVNTTLSNMCLHGNKYIILTIPDISIILNRKEKEGDKFGNKYYSIEFTNPVISPKDERESFHCGCKNEYIKDEEEKYGKGYDFSLIGSVDKCEEYLIETENLINKLKMHKFVLEKQENFLKYFDINLKTNQELFKKMNIHIGNEEESAVVKLYQVLIFKKYN